MERRRFLQMGLGSLVAISLPKFGVANPTALVLSKELENNPLLDFIGLPNFTAIQLEHIKPAVDYVIEYNTNVVKALTTQKSITWQNFYAPLEDAQNKLERVWSTISQLHSLKNSEALREVYGDAQKSLTEFYTWFGMHRPLYDAFNQLKQGKEYASYSKAQKKAIDNALLDFRLSGVALEGEDAKRYTEISTRLSELSTDFSNNVLDSEMGFEIVIEDKQKLQGLSDIALASAKKSAESKGLLGYRFGLDYPSYAAIVTYADDRKLRQQMFEAYRTRASDQGPNAGKWDNTAIMNELVQLRLERAKLLGFESHAEYSLANKMAESPAQVLDFLGDLLSQTHSKSKAEIQELEEYAKDKELLSKTDKLMPWDLSYLTEKFKQERYDIDKEMLRAYFPVDKVLSGMFELTNRLFGLTVRERKDVPVLHPGVRFFELFKEGKHIASFYLDLFARENKRSGAWHSDVMNRYQTADGSIQLPVSMIVCNFAAASGNEPALLLHRDVETLFHEFGHGLHHMLTQVDVRAVSGINGVAWDAVEFPSQILENWTWDMDTLGLISGHYQTGEPLPKDMIDRMSAAKNYQSATAIVRQLEFGLFDFRLHSEYQSGDTGAIARIREDIRQRISVVNEPAWVRMAHSFNHIFSGGYSAGYYGYMWADVLASDGFTRFQKEGVFNRKTGQDFIDAVLSQGGSDEPMALFEKFMGRKPDVTALLKSRGII
ncbi:M3 family metallopeptidase [Moraxella haemolytica]|uniref:M3 family metallopeptidase n=1 Tax=Moraxella haemolytica TaxID=2904119 RepID=UPI002543A4BF|nr:M3 family metallopeptidase [Moraxella sp. ZY171148]WII95044.1 M3 family metallopeptidase [Moraxella sp. ZY171148]